MKKMRKTTSIVLASTLLFGGFQTSYALVEDGDVQVPSTVAQQKVKELPDHVPVFVQEKHAQRFESSDVNSAKDYLIAQRNEHGVQQVEENFKAKEVQEDELGMTHIRFNQEKSGIPVEGAEIIVHFNDENEVTSMNGHISDDSFLDGFETELSLSEAEAIELAKSSVGAPDDLTYEPESELVIYPFGDDHYLTHKVNVNFMSGEPGIGTFMLMLIMDKLLISLMLYTLLKNTKMQWKTIKELELVFTVNIVMIFICLE
ncbi:hypothetical protein [Alkalibacillus haloalkaliphilus]|uniref:hypothetical protein n=1 Tax=Alkalibacillus haloalkaliphilus TaxID=94136 RepID=UPI0002DD2C00|nr:hypothetical protein [Alkalibacillus haloalkaliphilus]